MFLDLFYFVAFGGAILAAPLVGGVWLATLLLKIPPGRLRRGLYQGAVIAALIGAVIAYELMKPR